jgi:twitching motility protein PilJ
MRTQENIFTSTTPVVLNSNKSETVPQVDSSSPKQSLTRKGLSLRNVLLTAILPTVLVPLAIASVIGIDLVKTESKGDILEELENTVVQTGVVTSQFLTNGYKVNQVLSNNPAILQELQLGNERVQAQGLAKQAIKEVEQQFAQTKLINPNPTLNNYLQITAENNDLAEVILTENNGFNVAYSSPTSDFVQSDEDWWQIAVKEGNALLKPEFDESTQTVVIETVDSIKNPQTKQIVGVTKIGLAVEALQQKLLEFVGVELEGSQTVQIIDSDAQKVLSTFNAEGYSELGEVVGGDPIKQAVGIFGDALTAKYGQTANLIETGEEIELEQEFINNVVKGVGEIEGIANVGFETEEEEEYESGFLQQEETEGEQEKVRNILSFEFGGRFFQLKTIPGTDFVVVASIDQVEVAQAGNELRNVFITTAIILGLAAVLITIALARQVSKPLANLSQEIEKVAQGDLEVRVKPEGSLESQTLAKNFNSLVQRVKDLLQIQEAVAEEQKEKAQKLETEIYQLLEEIQDAAEGDLTVRASLDSMEMSTVADLFNAVIDSLQDIALQVKDSSGQVSSSLLENKQSIQSLAEQAMKQAEQSTETLKEVKAMSKSIEDVAQSAYQASILADDAYQETEEGSVAMDETVNSIFSLRTTVGETAEKMKRLGESSQKIAQIVALVEEITLKTNLLAINASRGGDQGQGFSVFGEQLAKLGEQSAAATKQIAQIVNDIRLETQEISEAMNIGNSQAVNTSMLVESTKEKLATVLESSRQINELMQSISQATILQTDTSQLITSLIQEISQQSQLRARSSQQVSESMETTAQVAQKLTAAVEKFKVSQE